MKKKLLLTAAAILLTAVVVFLLGRLTSPKYASGVLEGGMICEYYGEKNPHDVIFVGDCEVYENFSPVAMWRESGITSYIRGSAQQLIWQSYYLLEETFSRESPQVVVYNVQSMKYDEPQSEAYNRMTLDGMRLSRYKLDAIRASMTEDEDLITYLIPLLRYHSRWSELTEEDVTYWLSHKTVTTAGYLMRADCKPMKRLPASPILTDPELGAVCWEYLDRMRVLCEEHGAKLVLIKSSSVWPAWYEEWDTQISAYAEEHGLIYLNFLPLQEEIGIDFSTDTYDAGLHLNYYGAEKVSQYFARYLRDELGVPDRSGDAVIAADWQEKENAYDALLTEQLRLLEEYGYLKGYVLDLSQ